ncbi:MAG: hypothetical protein GC201_10690 [Alphaproteobacteria bacterium]|nr:hypothetical protein [Alphaproteobacteria bacterium]
MRTLYHLTPRNNLRAILSEGFRDRVMGYRARTQLRGVHFCERPAPNRMREPFAAVEVEVVLSEDELADFEWVSAEADCREFLIPAVRVNNHCLLHVISEAEAYAIARAHA